MSLRAIANAARPASARAQARALGAALALALLASIANAQAPAPAPSAKSDAAKAAEQVGLSDKTDPAQAEAERLKMNQLASPDDALTSVSKAVRFLIQKQNADGSWGTSTVESLFETNYSRASFYAWKMAGGALSIMALMKVDETPERRAALEKALDYLLEQPRPRRGSDWDIDNNWTALYAFNCLVEAANDARFQGPKWKPRIEARGKEYYEHLAANQDPKGGWGYYEGPVIARHPTWSTSFSTACVVPALVEAKQMGWPVEDHVLRAATEYVRLARLPSGAYAYDLRPIPRDFTGANIDNIKGSLGRIQTCNWALREAGAKEITDDVARQGLGWFFEHHKFLDVARWKPVPHESYYANAGYFYFFGHYHAAQLINTLPVAEREAWHAKLRPHVIKTQWADGSDSDFPGSFYSWTYGTSFAILTLELGLHPERFERTHATAPKAPAPVPQSGATPK